MADEPARSSDDIDEEAQRLQDLEELVKRIPGASRVVNELRDLRELLSQRRAPRVAVLGRRGSGKSSLANALLGAEALATGRVEDTTKAPAWVDLAVRGFAVKWLDTPGLRAGGEAERSDAVAEALKACRPDVVLVCFRAAEWRAGLDDDLKEVKRVLDVAMPVKEGVKRPVVGVLTRVDELPPLAERRPPFDAPTERREAIAAAKDAVAAAFERAGMGPVPVVPVVTWQRFVDGARVTDWRWGLEALAMEIHGLLPLAAQMEAARAFERARAVRRRVAMRFVGAATSVSVVVGATPLPVADLALLAPLQTVMLTGIVYASGRQLGPRAVTEWLGALGLGVGTGIGLREVVRSTLKLIPGIGASLSGAVAASGTWALGTAAVRYFIDGVSVSASKRAYEAALRGGAPSEALDAELPPVGDDDPGDDGGDGDDDA
ncbi:MAG: GTPase [Polyangiales bacterium]